MIRLFKKKKKKRKETFDGQSLGPIALGTEILVVQVATLTN